MLISHFKLDYLRTKSRAGVVATLSSALTSAPQRGAKTLTFCDISEHNIQDINLKLEKNVHYQKENLCDKGR